MSRPLQLRAGIVVALVAMAAGACSSSPGSETGSGDVASLSGGAPTTTVADGSDEASDDADFEQSMLDFAACMRENGVDMADPTFGEDGRPAFDGADGAAGGGGRTPMGPDAEQDPETQAARDACQPLLDDARGGFEPDPEQQTETRESILEFAACMRENGVEFADPTFGADGRPDIAQGEEGSGGGPGAGPGAGGPFGGLDQDDPTVAAALEVCQQNMPEAPGGGAGPGGPGGAGGGRSADAGTGA